MSEEAQHMVEITEVHDWSAGEFLEIKAEVIAWTTDVQPQAGQKYLLAPVPESWPK